MTTRSIFSVLICSVLLCSVARAQDDATPILSQSCYDAAKLKAQDTIANPQLTAGATFTMSNVKIIGSSHFDFATASANAWIYTFRSGLDDRTAAVLVYKSKTTGNCVALELPADSANILHERIDENAIQSDSMVYALAQNNTFESIAIQYPTLMADSLLVVNADETNSDLFPPGATIWIVNMHYTGGQMVCAWDASHKASAICNAVQTSVLDDAKANRTVLVYPNPASDLASFSVPEDNPTVLSVQLRSILGNDAVAPRNLGSASQGSQLIVPVDTLSNGSYIVTIETKKGRYTVPLKVIH